MSREELNKIREDIFCRFCGKQCKNLNSLYQHETRCKNNPDRKDYMNLANYSSANFKGQTAETNDIIRKVAESNREGYASGRLVHPSKGKPSSWLGKHHSEETKRRLSEVGKYNSSNHLNGWKAGNSKIPNKYEEYAAKFLLEHKILFEQEVVISTHKKGIKGVATYYQLDFLVNNSINLELDGSGHNFNNDGVRDDFISTMYKVYRIRHNDSLEELEQELIKFVNTLL